MTPTDAHGRMYATAAARSDGLLLLCGGRNAEGTPLGDAFGLARHRDGRWEWAAAPGSMPVARYQHGAVFVGARLHISGGAVGGGRMVDDAASVAVLDTVRAALLAPHPSRCWVWLLVSRHGTGLRHAADAHVAVTLFQG